MYFIKKKVNHLSSSYIKQFKYSGFDSFKECKVSPIVFAGQAI